MADTPKVPEQNVVGTMMRQPRKATPVVVEYDAPIGGRWRKEFKSAPAARRFYLEQSDLGTNPVILKSAAQNS